MTFRASKGNYNLNQSIYIPTYVTVVRVVRVVTLMKVVTVVTVVTAVVTVVTKKLFVNQKITSTTKNVFSFTPKKNTKIYSSHSFFQKKNILLCTKSAFFAEQLF